MSGPYIVLRLSYDPAFQLRIPDDPTFRENIRKIFDIYITNIISFYSEPRNLSEKLMFDTFISKMRNYLGSLCTPARFGEYPPELQASLRSPRTTSSAAEASSAEEVVLDGGSSSIPDPEELRQLRLKALKPSTSFTLPLLEQLSPPAPSPADPEEKYGGTIPASLWGNKSSLDLRATKLSMTLEAYMAKLKIPSKIKSWAELDGITPEQYMVRENYNAEIIKYVLEN